MRIVLPFPHKLLWPNGSEGTRKGRAGAAKRHKDWAWAATMEVVPRCFKHNGETIPVTIHVHPKRFGPAPDRDNCVAAAKHYLDGIALALGVNDRTFAAPLVVFGPRDDRFVIEIGE